jgi:hypothetical protein
MNDTITLKPGTTFISRPFVKNPGKVSLFTVWGFELETAFEGDQPEMFACGVWDSGERKRFTAAEIAEMITAGIWEVQ